MSAPSTAATGGNSKILVTLRVGDSAQSQVWDTSHPLPIGRPFRWVLETTRTGLRLRELGKSGGKASPVVARPVSAPEIGNITQVDLKAGFSLSLRAIQAFVPAYAEPIQLGGELRVYACLGNWILSSETVSSSYRGKKGEQTVFELKKRGDQVEIQSKVQGLTTPGGKTSFGIHELAGRSVQFGNLTWKFDLKQTAATSSSIKDTALIAEAAWFKRALILASGLVVALISISSLMPKHETKDELIPEQFAKIVIPPRLAQPAPAAPSGAETPASSKNPVPKSVQKAEVVQAFRAAQLKNAMSGLLRGGMTKLLEQSDFVAGNAQSANARKIFNANSKAVQATATETGAIGASQVKVSALGGEGAGSGSGQGVGYGKGTRAGVNGQGKSLVSMDTPGAAVDEGLTKDEVGEVIHKHLSEVRYCYESAMIRTPDIEGKLMAAFTIGGNGVVKTADVQQSTLPDPRLDDCIIRRLMTWKFPNPRGGVEVKVSYPFLFKTLGR